MANVAATTVRIGTLSTLPDTLEACSVDCAALLAEADPSRAIFDGEYRGRLEILQEAQVRDAHEGDREERKVRPERRGHQAMRAIGGSARSWVVAGCVGGALRAPALAADRPARVSAPAVPPPVFTWTGFYLGFNYGYGWAGDGRMNLAATPLVDTTGLWGGAQVGYNQQFGRAVAGVVR